MTRSEGRELAFKLLYSLEIQKIEEIEQEEQIDLFIEQNEIEKSDKVYEYITETMQGIKNQKEEITKLITENFPSFVNGILANIIKQKIDG